LLAERKFTTETSLESISREKKLQERVDELQKSNAHELQTQLNLARIHIEKLKLDMQDAKTLKQLLIASSQVGMLVGAHVKTSISDSVIPLVFRGKMYCLVELIPPTLHDGPLPLWVCQFLGPSPKNMHNFPGAAPAGSNATTSASAPGLGTLQWMFPFLRCHHQHRPTRSVFVWVLLFLVTVFEF